MSSKVSILLILLIFFLSCNFKKYYQNNNDLINKNLAYYLDSLQVDTFSNQWEVYPGVINLFARTINDSNFIFLLPGQCFFKTPDYLGSFVYNGKYFVCQGDSFIIKSLVDLDKVLADTTINWKNCNEVGIYDYDPGDLVLLMKSKNSIELTNVSGDKKSEIMFGKTLPPPTVTNYDD